jgi:hypothetical protein
MMERPLALPPGREVPTPLPWWLNPIWCLGAWTLPLLLMAYGLSPEAYAELWQTNKHITLEVVGQGLLLLGTLGWGLLIGTLAVSVVPVRDGDHLGGRLLRGERVLAALFKIGFWLTLVGYGLWLLAAIARGFRAADLLAMAMGEPGVADVLKQEYFQTLPGLTTLTQFGPATVLIGLLLLKLRRPVLWPIALLVGVSAVRGFFLSERLALLELLVPAAVLGLRLLPAIGRFGGRWRRGGLALAPVAAVGGLMVFFTAFEYNRSWVAHYAHTGISLWEFGSSRLTGYYVTAINNSALLLTNMAGPLPAPYYTLEWLWAFPGLSSVFDYEALHGVSPESLYGQMLVHGGNPEFNNGGGLLLPIADYGLVGAALYWALVGVLIGACFILYRRGSLAGLLLYPILFQGLLELPRLLYGAAGRVFPTWLMLLAACLLLGLRRDRLAPRGREVAA